MKNSESISNNQDNQATNEWERLLGDHAKNAIGSGTFQTVADFRKEKAAREEYDPERAAWEKAHPHHGEDKKSNEDDLPRTALDYMREDLEELQYGPLESYEKQPEEWQITETDENITSRHGEDMHQDTQQDQAPIVSQEPQTNTEDLPKSSDSSKASKPSNSPKSSEVSDSQMEIPDFLNPKGDTETNQINSQKSNATPNTHLETEHLKWPEETHEEIFDRAMDQAENALGHARDALDEQNRDLANERGYDRSSELKEDEIDEINRVIAEMATSDNKKLVEIMHQKDYESDEDHKNRLVMMAKTEIRWRQLKKSIEDMKKHMQADNEAVARTRAALMRNRKIADTPPRQASTSTESAPKQSAPELTSEPVIESSQKTASEPKAPDSVIESTPAESQPVAPESTHEPEQKILKKDLANRVRDILKKREEAELSSASSEKSEPDLSNGEGPELKSNNEKTEFNSQPEEKTSQKDLKDILLTKIADKEASSVQAESESQPEKKILQKDLKDVLRAKIAEREAILDSNSDSLQKAKAILAEHERRVSQIDELLNAERNKIVEGRPPATRRKINKIFSSLSQKFKDKSREKARKRFLKNVDPWSDD